MEFHSDLGTVHPRRLRGVLVVDLQDKAISPNRRPPADRAQWSGLNRPDRPKDMASVTTQKQIACFDQSPPRREPGRQKSPAWQQRCRLSELRELTRYTSLAGSRGVSGSWQPQFVCIVTYPGKSSKGRRIEVCRSSGTIRTQRRRGRASRPSPHLSSQHLLSQHLLSPHRRGGFPRL